MSQNLLSKLKHYYVRRQAAAVKIPELALGPVIRQHLLFSGKVQNVGFRYQTALLAERLGLTGWVANCRNGDVEMEIQGSAESIAFLIHCLKQLKRMTINEVREEQLPLDPDCNTFQINK